MKASINELKVSKIRYCETSRKAIKHFTDSNAVNFYYISLECIDEFSKMPNFSNLLLLQLLK